MTASPAHPPTTALPLNAQVAGTASFSKFMRVLQLVADSEDLTTVSTLVRSSGYPRPTVHRIVAALVAERLLVEGSNGGLLTLGPRLIQLASKSWGRSDLRIAAVDALKQLRDLTGETVHLAVPSGASMVYIEKLESPSAVRMDSRIGVSVSLHSTAVGKAYLAALNDDAQKSLMDELQLVRHTARTVCSAAALRADLLQTRKRGWSEDDEENETGIFCFGAPIFNAAGLPVGAVSVSTLLYRQKANPNTAYAAPLLKACKLISDRIAQTPSLSMAA